MKNPLILSLLVGVGSFLYTITSTTFLNTLAISTVLFIISFLFCYYKEKRMNKKY